MVFAFEGARGLAALLVALYHIGNLSRFLAFRHSYLCVDLFFVLSGWVIADNYWAKVGDWASLKTFVIRRSGRLLPLFFFSTIFYIATTNFILFMKYSTVLVGSPIRPQLNTAISPFIPKISEIIGVLTLSQGLGFFDRLILNGPSWSISTEFYTYLIFAFGCIFFADRMRTILFTILIFAGAAVTIIGATRFPGHHLSGGYMDVSYNFGFPRCIWSFFMGVLLFRFGKSILISKLSIQYFSVFSIATSLLLIERFPAVAFLFPVLFVLLVFSISTDAGPIPKLLNTKGMQLLGKRSYSIYLMHVPVTLLFAPITSRLAGRNLLFPVAEDLAFMAVLVFVSGMTFRYIEDPFRKWAKRISVR